MKRKITFEEYSLIVSSLHLEFSKDPKNFSFHGEDSIFFGISSGVHRVHYFRATDAFWITVGKAEYEYTPPSWWQFKKREAFVKVQELMDEITDKSMTEIEKNICDTIPSAKDIIAEKALLSDEH